MYIPETDIIEKLYGIGPNIITEIMVDKWFKYVELKSIEELIGIVFLLFFFFADIIPDVNVLITFLFVISQYNVMQLLFITTFGTRKCSCI